MKKVNKLKSIQEMNNTRSKTTPCNIHDPEFEVEVCEKSTPRK